MPITVLPDVILPNSVINAGVRGKNLRQNTRVQTEGGYQSINVGWARTLRQYEVGTVPMLVSQWRAIETLFEITEGGAYGFLMEDPKDRTASDGIATVRDGGGYQLFNRYSDPASLRSKSRKITRPRGAGFVVSVNGAPLAPGNYTLDETTGRLSIPSLSPSPENAALIAWGGQFFVPVHFADDSIDWEMVAGGPADARFLSGPSVLLQEVRE
jgi:uncharacterized protein (TIGR02217 family)